MNRLSLKLLLAGLSAVVVLSIAASGCSKKSNSDMAKEIQLTTSASLGSILTDKAGRTLYYFANDAKGLNSCIGGCEFMWPVFNVDDLERAKLGAGLEFTDFKSITTSTGRKQITYKGHPLYYYAPLINGANVQELPGQTGGENVNGVWFVAKPDYTIMLTNNQLVGEDGRNYTSTYTVGIGMTMYFTDANGVTLYTFKNDKQNKNNFTASDFSNNGIWPIYETNRIVVPSALDKSLFGSIAVFGRKQLTYKGWPLYYFGLDNRVMGVNKGVSVPTPGAWPVPVKDMSAALP